MAQRGHAKLHVSSALVQKVAQYGAGDDVCAFGTSSIDGRAYGIDTAVTLQLLCIGKRLASIEHMYRGKEKVRNQSRDGDFPRFDARGRSVS